MKFEKLTDYRLMKKYLNISPAYFSNISAGYFFMWHGSDQVEFAETEDALLLSITHKGKQHFCFPLGANVDKALSALEKYCLERHIPLSFYPVDDATAAYLTNRYYDAAISSERNWSDYIYNAENLKTFAGKKYSAQRNRINKFKKQYGAYVFEPFSPERAPEYTLFLKKWGNSHEFSNKTDRYEYNRCFEIINAADALGCVGGCIRYDGDIIAFAIGEVVGNTLVIHVEKADREYDGAYQIIVSEFAKAFAVGKVKYINREDDSGDIGLRTSKMRYHPIEIRTKNHVLARTLFERINPPVLIYGDVTLTDINETDAEPLFRLNTDEKNNRYWGYDYKSEFNGEPTPQYFFDLIKNMKATGEEYSLAIRVDGKMAGEALLYNFDYAGGVETGIRLLPEYQGKGIGPIADKMLARYAQDFLGAQTIKAKCFKENTPSRQMLQKAGYQCVGCDEVYFYFKFKK